MLVPVPVHADRLRKRSYDQAVLIARVAARELRLPCAEILVRARATAAQYDLGREHRAANVEDAFAIVGLPSGSLLDPRLPLQGRWPILVDDVVTTGATLAACARVLLEHGAIGVSAVTVARER